MNSKRVFAVTLVALVAGCGKTDEAAPTPAPASSKKKAVVVAAVPNADQIDTGIIANPKITARSPMSTPTMIAERLSLPVGKGDYQLSDFHWMLFIPPSYDAKKPMGLLVLNNYKPSGDLPNSLLSLCNQYNLAFVVCKEHPGAAWQRSALALDAVFSIAGQYAVDPHRIYIMGDRSGPDPNGSNVDTAQRLGLGFPEVFTGTIATSYSSYRIVRAAGGRYWPAEFRRPADRLFDLAKTHPVFIAPPQEAEGWQRFADMYREDKFKSVKYRIVTAEDYHYPNYTTDWFVEAIEFLDAANKPTKPATAPSTKHAK